MADERSASRECGNVLEFAAEGGDLAREEEEQGDATELQGDGCNDEGAMEDSNYPDDHKELLLTSSYEHWLRSPEVRPCPPIRQANCAVSVHIHRMLTFTIS